MANLPGIVQLSDLTNFTATALSAGIIQLTGDLGGVATLPLVVGLQGVDVSSSLPTFNQVLTYNGTIWAPTDIGSNLGGDLRGPLLDSTVVGIQGVSIIPFPSATAGSSTSGFNPTTTLTGLSPSTTAAVGITVDGFLLQYVTFNALTSTTGLTIALNLQTAINAALTAAESTASVTVTYSGVTPTNYYTVTSTSTGSSSSVVFSSPVFLPPLPNWPDVTPLLKLGVANGGIELTGTSGTIPSGYVLTAGDSNTAVWAPSTGGGGLSFADDEIPVGIVDGANITYTLAHAPVIGSVSFYRGGLLQRSGISNDYTVLGQVITTSTAPIPGTILLASYRY